MKTDEAAVFPTKFSLDVQFSTVSSFKGQGNFPGILMDFMDGGMDGWIDIQRDKDRPGGRERMKLRYVM